MSCFKPLISNDLTKPCFSMRRYEMGAQRLSDEQIMKWRTPHHRRQLMTNE